MNKVHNGFFGWEKVCNTYTAKGDEKYITIGNFDRNETTRFEAVKKPKESEADPIAHAYYYIDNVIIRLVDNVSECACYNARPPKIEDGFSTLIYDKAPEITDKMTVDKKIEAHSIYFRQGKASLTENAKENMNFVIEQMNANPAMKIEISGNNDELEVKASKENEDYSDLDRKRVAVAVKYFVAQGISEERIIKTYKGTSSLSTEIVEDDEQDVKDAKCRRVEFRVKM
jgi:outer membrane protein OmpA-like peptidoglycan-associated protein